MTFLNAWVVATTVILFCHGCSASAQTVDVGEFGRTAEGEKVERFVLTNANGLRAEVMTWGATLIGLHVPDRQGNPDNITLHLGSFADYEKGHPLFGSVVGRFANRIDTGGFVIDGRRFDLKTVNSRTNVHIHGGKEGLAKVMWKGKAMSGEDFAGVQLTHTSPDGHEGYPGEVDLSVNYRLTNDSSLEIEYRGTTSQATHLNLTNHAYFNLGGAGSGEVHDQILTLKAERLLEFDERKIPTGEYLTVSGTPFDFREPQSIGSRIGQVEGGGYDHCYVLSEEEPDGSLRWFARVADPESGRVMDVLTTSPGVQFYTANYLKPALKTPEGVSYGPHHGFCLETQFFPDSPNKPEFPSSLVRPGELYRQLTVFRFSVEP